MEVKTDDFTKEITYISPYKRGLGVSLFAHKKPENSFLTYAMLLSTTDSTPYVGQTDVKLLMEDGEIWEKKIEIDCEVENGRYYFTAYVPLNIKEAVMLTRNKLVKFRLYVLDKSFTKEESNLIATYMNCLLDKDESFK